MRKKFKISAAVVAFSLFNLISAQVQLVATNEINPLPVIEFGDDVNFSVKMKEKPIGPSFKFGLPLDEPLEASSLDMNLYVQQSGNFVEAKYVKKEEAVKKKKASKEMSFDWKFLYAESHRIFEDERRSEVKRHNEDQRLNREWRIALLGSFSEGESSNEELPFAEEWRLAEGWRITEEACRARERLIAIQLYFYEAVRISEDRIAKNFGLSSIDDSHTAHVKERASVLLNEKLRIASNRSIAEWWRVALLKRVTQARGYGEKESIAESRRIIMLKSSFERDHTTSYGVDLEIFKNCFPVHMRNCSLKQLIEARMAKNNRHIKELRAYLHASEYGKCSRDMYGKEIRKIEQITKKDIYELKRIAENENTKSKRMAKKIIKNRVKDYISHAGILDIEAIIKMRQAQKKKDIAENGETEEIERIAEEDIDELKHYAEENNPLKQYLEIKNARELRLIKSREYFLALIGRTAEGKIST